MGERNKVNLSDIKLRADEYEQNTFKLYKTLAVPSYVHGYSICIEYFYNWFRHHFKDNYFRGGIYVDGSHVLSEYKQLNLQIVKRENPRARIIAELDTDYDRDDLDNYLGSPDVLLRRSRFQDSFFKDYENKLFLGIQMKGLRMTFNSKIRVNTKSEQLDLWNYMQLNFRNGATQYEYISVDFHIPKSIIINIAERMGFETVNGEIKDIISFLAYFNQHSELPLLFKIRAINKKPEFFLRVNDVYVHILCKDKLRLANERDGKLDNNFDVEMENIIDFPIPAFFILADQEELKVPIAVSENDNMTALYSINVYDIPPVNEKGWNQAAITSYQTDDNDIEMDISSLFTGENILARTIAHDLVAGVSPSHFIDVKVYHGNDIAKLCNIHMDWNRKVAVFDQPQKSDIYQIVMYYDREYINSLDIELNKYNDSRIGPYNKYHDQKTN